MHILVFGAFCALAKAATATTTTPLVCNANNCLRAVRATNSPTHTADCSSYFETTVTPATSTFTHTVTITDTATTLVDVLPTDVFDVTATVVDAVTATVIEPARRRRDFQGAAPLEGREFVVEARQDTVTPSNIPAYASACSGSVGYSSACSCIGVTANTITVAAPSTTVTVSATVTPTTETIFTTPSTFVTTTTDATATETTTVATVTTCAAPLPTFLLQAADTYVDGGYAELYDGGLDGYTIAFVSNQSGATTFSIDASGHLIANGQTATFGSNPVQAAGANYNDNYVLFQPNPTEYLITCELTSGTLSCSYGDLTESAVCNGAYYLLNPADDGCDPPLTLNAVSVTTSC